MCVWVCVGVCEDPCQSSSVYILATALRCCCCCVSYRVQLCVHIKPFVPLLRTPPPPCSLSCHLLYAGLLAFHYIDDIIIELFVLLHYLLVAAARTYNNIITGTHTGAHWQTVA